MMRKKSLQVVCVQETKWKGSKAKEIGAGYKLYYHGEDSKRNGIGIVLCEELNEGVLAVTRPCDRVMRIKLEIEGEVWHIISCYAPQTVWPQNEKETFWEHMDSEMQTVTITERVVVAGDLMATWESIEQDITTYTEDTDWMWLMRMTSIGFCNSIRDENN